MITNISDRKDTCFLSIDKAFSNKIKLSLLKKVFFLYYEWHFHEFLERCCSILEYRMIFSHADLADNADYFKPRIARISRMLQYFNFNLTTDFTDLHG